MCAQSVSGWMDVESVDREAAGAEDLLDPNWISISYPFSSNPSLHSPLLLTPSISSTIMPSARLPRTKINSGPLLLLAALMTSIISSTSTFWDLKLFTHSIKRRTGCYALPLLYIEGQTAQTVPAATVSYVAFPLLGNVPCRRSWTSQPQKHMAYHLGHSSNKYILKNTHGSGHTRPCTSLVFIPDSCHSFGERTRAIGGLEWKIKKALSEKEEMRL